MTIEFVEYPDREMMALSLANSIAGQLGQHLRTNDRAVLCVPGGSTPVPLFTTLSGSDIDWSRVTVLPGDERWVDDSHRRSNGRMLRRHLLRDRAAAARYIDLYTGDPDPADAVATLSGRVAGELPITVLLLGMGHDMHTASLFPGRSETEAALAPGAPSVVAVGGEEPRVTLTASALKTAIWRHLMIAGTDKRQAFEQAQKLSPAEAPIKAFLNDITVHWAE